MRMMKPLKRKRWTDKEVRAWAKTYIKEKCTIIEVEKIHGVQHSTIWWCFTKRLVDIDSDLYTKVADQLIYNKYHHKVRRRSKEWEK